MRFSRTDQFKDDYKGLTKADQDAVDKAFREVALALQGDESLFKKYKIKKMQGWPGIWEGHVKGDYLCFTFHFDVTDTGGKNCFFRRVGTHSIYKNP